jgi:hypothetical protein
VRLSDDVITSKIQYAEKIVNFSQGKHLQVKNLPIFSNVGEAREPSVLKDRPRRLVIFGGKGPRSRVYNSALSALEKTCREFQIEEVFDLGPKLDSDLPEVNGKTVVCLGPKSAEEVSAILSSSRIGFFNYPTGYLAKSGIFAAYCAHRMLPVGISWEKQDIDNVQAGREYLEIDKESQPFSSEHAQNIADTAYSWYSDHSLPNHSRVFYQLLIGKES